MTKIFDVDLPSSEHGNDPNDFRYDRGFVDKVHAAKPSSALERLVSLSATNRLDEMRANMQKDVYIFCDMALSGQITLFYAMHNTGKTLLFMRFIIDAIKEGRIDAGKVIYVNADDFYGGILTKAEIASRYGFQMISTDESGTSPQSILELLEEVARENDATGIIIVLDTLKKFADMMSKRSQADLYKSLRKVVAKGGSVIIAGHANKRKDKNGNLIYEGTSDTMNDIDCAYALYDVSEPNANARTIEFRKEKDRGNVVSKATYEYKKSRDITYEDMVLSVRRLQASEVEQVEERQRVRCQVENYKAEISFVTRILGKHGQMNQTEILQALKMEGSQEEGVTVRRLREALKAMNDIKWEERQGEKHSKIYRLIERGE